MENNKEIELAVIDLIKKCKRKGFRGIERKISGYNVSLRFGPDESSNSGNELDILGKALSKFGDDIVFGLIGKK